MTDAGKTDLSLFHKDERHGEWEVFVQLTGTVRETVKAETAEEARAKVLQAIEDGEYELMSDDIDEARIDSIRPSPTMYLVSRNGQSMRVSHVAAGDLPREPGERGF